MLTPFRTWLHRLSFGDPLLHQQARIFQIMLLILTGVLSVGTIASTLASGGFSLLLALTGPLPLLLCVIAGLLLLRRGRFGAAVNAVVIGLVLAQGFSFLADGTANGARMLLTFAVPLVLAGLIGDRRTLLLAAGLSIGSIVFTVLLEAFAPGLTGFVAPPPEAPGGIIIFSGLLVVVLSLLLDRFGSSLRLALQNTRAREQELEQLRDVLESTVAQRTADLQQALTDVERREGELRRTVGELRTSEATVRELSAPIIPVLPGVLVAPLVGALSSERASLLTENVLQAVERERAQSIIFDITGVPVVDTHVARVLLDTAAAVRLIGAHPTLVGVRPEVAQTIVALGIDLREMSVAATLQEAISAQLLITATSRSPRSQTNDGPKTPLAKPNV